MKPKTIFLALAAALLFMPQSALCYTAKSGDTYWKIAKAHGVSLQSLLSANGKDEKSILNIGDTVLIPGVDIHIVKEGDTYWKLAKDYGVSFKELLNLNGADENTWLSTGQVIKLTDGENKEPYITYETYSVKAGDTLWSLSEKFGVPYAELLALNTGGESLYIGQKFTYPVHHIPETAHPAGCGEYLDWQNAAQYLVPIGAEFIITDFYTGESFCAKRTLGANHADCEPLTKDDTAKMKEIWGGAFSWQARPVLVTCRGRVLAASAASYPHAGCDSAPAGKWTSWRSGDYGAGENYDYVKGNNYDGHFDLYFHGATSHNTGQINASHEKNIKIAAGI